MKKPLAFRMRPNKLSEVIGQDSITGKNGFLTNCLKNNVIVSSILYGPPGTGKTTIAEAFAKSFQVNYISLNATSSNKSDLVQALDNAKLNYPTILIIDEIHRLNKDKQDILLPRLESGDVYLLGATTANPLLSINPAIRSRTHLLEVKPLTTEEITIGLNRAIKSENGLNNTRNFSQDAIRMIARTSGGDLRYAYNILEAVALSYTEDTLIDVQEVSKVSSIPNFFADKDENEHYDTVSALQKSIRGSEVDAAIYYLAKLCQSGDLEGIIRRLLVTAYEDVGLANPYAVDRCLNACNVAREVGFPEAIIPLGFAVCDLTLSPKSKSACLAIQKAFTDVEKNPQQVRDYLKLNPVNISKEDAYPYDRPDLWKYIEYLPEGKEDSIYYKPWLNGNYEKSLNINYQELKKIKRSTSISELKRKFPKK